MEPNASMHLTAALAKPPGTRSDIEDDILLSFVRRLDYFRSYSSESLNTYVVPYMTYRRLRINEVLLGDADLHNKEGPYQGPIFVVLSGVVEMRVMTPFSRFATDILKGEAIGEPHTLLNLPPATYFVVKEASEVLVVPSAGLKRYQEQANAKDLEEKIEFLSTKLLVPLFNGLNRADIEEVAKSLYSVRFPSRYVILKEKENGSEMFFLRSGECRVVREIEFPQGSTSVVKLMEMATLLPGEYFGELSLLNYDITQNGNNGKGGITTKHGGKTDPKDDKALREAVIREEDVFGSVDAEEEPTEGETATARTLRSLAREVVPPMTPRQATVYSHSVVEVYVLSVHEFVRTILPVTRRRMQEYCKGYPSTNEIRAHFRRQNQWQSYKQSVLKEVFGPYSRYKATPSMHNVLSNDQ